MYNPVDSWHKSPLTAFSAVIIALVTILAIAVAVSVTSAVTERGEILRSSQKDHLLQAQLLAENIEGVIQNVDFVLQTISSPPDDGHSLLSLIEQKRIQAPNVGSLYLVDKSGRKYKNATSEDQLLSEEILDNIYTHHASSLNEFVISNTQDWGISPFLRIVISRSYFSEDGEMQGVAISVLDQTSIFRRLYDYGSLTAESLHLYNSHGKLLWVWPEPQQTPDAPLSGTLDMTDRSLFGSTSTIVNDTMYGIYQMHILPLRVSVSSSLALIMQPWKERLFSHLLIAAVSVLGVLLLLLLMRNHLKRNRELAFQQEDNATLLAQQSKLAAVGEMLGFIAHQWKQPLNLLSLIIDSFMDLPEEDETDSPFTRARAHAIGREQIDLMARIIEDFQRFLNPREDKECFCAVEATLWILQMFAPQLVRNQVAVSVRCADHPSDTPQVKADGVEFYCDPTTEPYLIICGKKSEFSQIIINLIMNAKDAYVENKQAGREGISGEIELIFGSEDGMLTIQAQDHAGGIPHEVLPKIFNSRFTTKGEKGTGIGLHIVRLIVEQKMNGTITVENNGNGALFSIRTPLATLDEMDENCSGANGKHVDRVQ